MGEPNPVNETRKRSEGDRKCLRVAVTGDLCIVVAKETLADLGCYDESTKYVHVIIHMVLIDLYRLLRDRNVMLNWIYQNILQRSVCFNFVVGNPPTAASLTVNFNICSLDSICS